MFEFFMEFDKFMISDYYECKTVQEYLELVKDACSKTAEIIPVSFSDIPSLKFFTGISFYEEDTKKIVVISLNTVKSYYHLRRWVDNREGIGRWSKDIRKYKKEGDIIRFHKLSLSFFKGI
jgi:hypothetical protein